MADRGALPKFDKREVIKSEIAVRKAGDGLSEAVGIDPVAFHIGEKVYVVLETEVTAVDHRPVPKTDVLARKHVLTTETATVVDGAMVEEVLAKQRERIEAARLEAQREKEAAAGVQRVPGTEPWADGDEDDDDLPGDGFSDDDSGVPGDELAPPANADDAAWERGEDDRSE